MVRVDKVKKILNYIFMWHFVYMELVVEPKWKFDDGQG
jgi:hypothetical protein